MHARVVQACIYACMYVCATYIACVKGLALNTKGVSNPSRIAPGSAVALYGEAVLSQGCSEQQLIDDLREHAPMK